MRPGGRWSTFLVQGMRYGRYETLQPIASGGMATVYLGRVIGSAGFERRVAIKVMHPHVATDPEFIDMFLDEARLAARIHHPNVVGTLDFQRLNEGTFLVMEFIEGASLREVLRALRKRRQRMPIGTAVRIMVDALSGLHAAHELRGDQGDLLHVVHRDVSPHNILVGADGITRITDFGVARATARLTSTRGAKIKGKIAYMAPEQMGPHIDRRADIYSAGVVLWESLTGRRLFKADHEGALIAQILAGAERSPRQMIPVIPDSVDAVCMRALALHPDDRFPTAAEFADALENAAISSNVRIPTPRQLAAFVHQYKVPIGTSGPPSQEEGPPDSVTAPQSYSGIPASASQPSVASSHGSSQLSGIGAVHSQRAQPPPPRSRLRIFGGVLLGLALVSIGGAAALVQSGVVVSPIPLPWQRQPAASEPAGETTAPEPEPAAETAAPEEPSAPPEAPVPVATASASAAPKTWRTPAVAAPRPIAAPTPKPPDPKAKKSPLGFEPDDL